ncbi:hypothetical protein ACFYWY_19605 [Streptomyces sp. NPDC002870]|uniref:hypothetical protein n=1 Tax=Streptomyces sp. NPDC002870 TaxID=3364666 RepID=UPI0036766DE1
MAVASCGVVTNSGSAHEFSGGFSAFGFEVTGSTGTLFLYGIVVGAAALFGLSLLLTGARRTSRRGSTKRRGLKQTRTETAATDESRAANARGNGSPQDDRPTAPNRGRRSRLHWFGHRSAPQ